MAWSLPDYDEIQEIGTGSSGSVMLSRDRATGTLVAIKYLSKRVYRSDGFAERFRDDADVLTGIESEHVAMLYEYVEGSNSAALVMELVDGVSLRQIIDRGTIEPVTTLYVARAALLGLEDIHRRGITHGDVRPENLLIDARGVVKVVDAGIPARVSGNAHVTGDRRYLAPEVAAGQLPTPASDVYAVAVTLLECLTGEPPHAPNDNAVGRVGDHEVESLSAAGVGEPAQTLLTHELANQPLERSISASALVDALDRAARGAYGRNWLNAGEAGLGRLLSLALVSDRSDAADAIATDGRRRWRTVLVLGAALLLIVGFGVFALAGGLFGPGTGAQANAGPGPNLLPTQAAPGPAVPTPAPLGPRSDTVKPDQPTGLTVIGRSLSAITIDWNPSHDNVKVVGYIVTRDGARVGTTYVPGFTSAALTADTKYSYAVTAFDAAGNLSLNSPAVVATTLAQPDRIPPSASLHPTPPTQPPVATQSPAPTSPVSVVLKRIPLLAPVCLTTIEADVTVTGGLVDVGNVHLTYTINGVTKSTTVLIDVDNVAEPVVLNSAVSGATSGSATVTVTSPANGPTVSTTWDPTKGCT